MRCFKSDKHQKWSEQITEPENHYSFYCRSKKKYRYDEKVICWLYSFLCYLSIMWFMVIDLFACQFCCLFLDAAKKIQITVFSFDSTLFAYTLYWESAHANKLNRNTIL